MKHAVGDTVADRFLVRAHILSDIDGERYEVLDLSTKIPFKLQICNPTAFASEAQKQKLKQMALAAISMTHENIAPVYATGHTESGALYFVLDAAHGLTLGDLLKREPSLPIDQAISLLIQIAQALSYAHENGHLHGHLTPANVQITEGPQQSYQAKVMNFGMDELTNTQYTYGDYNRWHNRKLWQHVYYVSPEQCRFGSLSKQTDIYSFGCIMFQLLTGHPPFQGRTAAAVLWKHISEDIPWLPDTLPMRKELQVVVNCCLDKDPSKRYASAMMLALDLDRIQNAGSAASPLLGWKAAAVFDGKAIASRISALLSIGWREVNRSRRVFL